MMAQTQVVLDEQDFTCPICLELLEDPISIPCGHSYCSHCIWQYLGNTGVETVSCPECRAPFPSIPLLGRNIMLAETVEKLRASTRQQVASPVNTAFAPTATTVTNVQQPSASASVPTNVRQPQRTSASVSTNVQQPQRISASVSTNVQQPQRTSASVSPNVRQPSATVSTNVQQPQHTSASVSTNVRQPSTTVSTNAQQPQRTSASVSTNVRQPSATVSTNVRQPQRTSASVSTNVQQPRHTSASRATDVRWFRILALLFACVAFSVALHASQVRHHQVGEWCIFCWGFCFIGTAVVLLVELCGLQSRVPISWKDFPITFACYACLLCLSASVLFAVYFVKGFTIHDGLSYNCRMVSLVFSCLATIAYLAEVGISKAQPDTEDRFGYMATTPGLLKVCETFVACFIFVFISNPNSYESHAAIKWCMAVYCICFILSIMVIILCVRNCTSCLSNDSSCVLSFYALLAVIMYLTATIIWPIYKFDKQHGASILRRWECYRGPFCPFDELIVVAVLTGVNFILYLLDLIYSIKQVMMSLDDDESTRL